MRLSSRSFTSPARTILSSKSPIHYHYIEKVEPSLRTYSTATPLYIVKVRNIAFGILLFLYYLFFLVPCRHWQNTASSFRFYIFFLSLYCTTEPNKTFRFLSLLQYWKCLTTLWGILDILKSFFIILKVILLKLGGRWIQKCTLWSV